MSGLELLDKLNIQERGLMVIMITAYGLVETAVKAMKLGAYDYISKPFTSRRSPSSSGRRSRRDRSAGRSSS